MNARPQDYRVLWRAALSHSNPFASAIIRWGGAFIGIAFIASVWYTEGPHAMLVLAWRLACGAVLLTWTWRFIPGALKLASPANAKLVPGMRRRLVELACLVWFAAIAGLALTTFAGNGAVGSWLFWVVLGTVGSALGVAGHQAGGPLVIATVFGWSFFGRLPDSIHETLSHPAMLALALLLYAGLIAAAVRAMLPEGGERHWRMIERRARIAPAPGKPDPLLAGLAGTKARNWYAVSLRRDSARRDSRRLALHALGPAHHPGELLTGLALVSSVLVGVAILTTWRTGGEPVRDIGWIFACMLMIIPLSMHLRLDGLLGAYPGEQALVRLAPAMPGAAAAFNRHLGRALLLQGVKGWVLSTGVAMLLAALGGASQASLLLLASTCCLLLPVLAAPLRNHALRAPSSAVVSILMLALSVAASLGIGFALRPATGLPVLPLAAIASIAIAAWTITRGLRVMEGAPFAFPAGRTD